MTSPVEAMRAAGKDPVSPPHYRLLAVEPIDAFEAWYAREDGDPVLCALLWQVNKYLVRAGRKDGNPALVDLKKSAWYLERAIRLQERRR